MGHDPAAAPSPSWTVRVQAGDTKTAAARAGRSSFVIEGQASFGDGGAHPCAVEYLLGALGGDLVCGFRTQAARRGIEVDSLELSITGRLNNALAHVGVIGEDGHAGIEAIDGTLFVSAEAGDADMAEIWRATLGHSPLVQTLQRCVELSLEVKLTL
jgi:uncharacterized OsmC-like protein